MKYSMLNSPAFILVFLYAVQCKLLTPVLLIPGDGGNQLEGKLDKSHVSHFYCSKKTDWFTIWLDIESFILQYQLNCYVNNLKLVYNSKTHQTSNPKGVQIRWASPGDLSGLKTLDTFGLLGYYETIIDKLKDAGYKEGQSLKGLCYDCRKAGNELKETMFEMVTLIENMYYENNNKSVCLVSHSMGGLLILQLLEGRSQDWKDKYIDSVIAIGTPYFGSVKSIQATVSGYDFGISILPSKKLRKAQRTYPSTAWLFPNPEFWNSTHPVMKTPKRVYTLNDYKDIYNDIGFPQLYQMYKDTTKILDFHPPGVSWHTIYGTGIKTAYRLIYDKDFPNSEPETVDIDGDGTVDIRSATGSRIWKGKQDKALKFEAINNTKHGDLLKSDAVLKYLRSVLSI